MEREDCYSYVRRNYGVPATVGARVRVKGREGALARRMSGDQYVYITFDGDKKWTGPFHPTDGIEYLDAR